MKKIIGHLLGWVLLFASPAVAYAEETLVLHTTFSARKHRRTPIFLCLGPKR